MAVAKRRWLKLLAGCVLLGTAGFFVYRWKAKKAKAEPPPENASLASVERGTLKTSFKEMGDLAAKTKVDVASKVSGRIIELVVHEGARVKAGQKLAVVQPGKTGNEKFLPSTISSPIDGVVLGYVKNPTSNNPDIRFAEIGDYVTGIFDSQNPTYMMTVADMRTVIVKLRINEMDILKLREDMPVTVTVDALKDTEFPASVSMISPQAEKEARGGKIFRVEVALGKPDPRLRTGMTARVEAVLEKREDALKVPLAGIFEEMGNELCYVEVPGGKPRQTLVKTGMRTEKDAEILEGLKEGDKVLTEKPVAFEPVPGGLKKGEGRRKGRKDKEDWRDAQRAASRIRRGSSMGPGH